MIKCGAKWLIIVSLTAGFAAAAQAEDLDVGKSEFQSSCASCHGTDAKGKGPVSDQLKIPPPDLTMLAKSNTGLVVYQSQQKCNSADRFCVVTTHFDAPSKHLCCRSRHNSLVPAT